MKTVRLTESDLIRIVKRVMSENKHRFVNEGQIVRLPEGSFELSDMKGKTINLYDDQEKKVWDQTWKIVNITTQNYDKDILFTLDKDVNKTGTPETEETGTMLFYCNKPDSFTVNYDYKGIGSDPNVNKELRYNPEVSKMLKDKYCPGVLNVPAGNADFAQNKSTPSKANFA